MYNHLSRSPHHGLAVITLLSADLPEQEGDGAGSGKALQSWTEHTSGIMGRTGWADGWGIITANLTTIARTVARRQGARNGRAA